MISSEKSFEGLVLFAVPFQEDSAICSLATERGIVATMAGHVYRPKSPLKSLLIPGALVRVDGRKGTKGPILARQALTLYDTSSLVVEEKGNAFLCFFQEVAKSFFQYGDRFPVLETTRIIRKIAEGRDLLSMALLFVGSVYRTLGLPMEVHSCVRCGKREVQTYSLEEGGLLCQDCAESLHVPTHPKMEVLVLKFAFLDLDERNLRRVVPRAEGRVLLEKLVRYLCSYFDLPMLRCFPTLSRLCPIDAF